MINIGVICPSEIAFRRFLPALSLCQGFNFVGVACAEKEEFEGATKDILDKENEKAHLFVNSYGGQVFKGYQRLIEDAKVDAIYLPLPPGLHFRWAIQVIEAGKHAFVEKPCTTSLADTEALIRNAREKHLALHENYMFVFHQQLSKIHEIIQSGRLGDIRLFRIDFGFPLRSSGDFRYKKSLGGGALFDCAGYTMRCASYFLGDSAKVVYGKKNNLPGFEVDMYGSATMMNDAGVIGQLSWGMDNNYRCDLDIWGSKGSLHTDRILTAPVDFIPHATIKDGNNPPEVVSLGTDDAFKHSIDHFECCVLDDVVREETYSQVHRQAIIIDEFIKFTS